MEYKIKLSMTLIARIGDDFRVIENGFIRKMSQNLENKGSGDLAII